MEYFREAGITGGSTQEEIRAIYLLLAKTHHPDRSGSTATFQAIHRAYEELSSFPFSSSFPPSSFSPSSFPPSSFPPSSSPFPSFSELFETQGEAMLDSVYESIKKCLRKGSKGPDKHVDLSLSLADIYWGRTVVVQVNRERFAESGELVPDRCLLEVKVTPTTREIRCDSKCSDSAEFSKPGDIVFHVKCDWEITEDGRDLKTTVLLEFAESLLGWTRVLEDHPAKVVVSVEGKVTLNETDIVIAGAGMPLGVVEDEMFGDLIVRCKVKDPTLTQQQREALASIFKD